MFDDVPLDRVRAEDLATARPVREFRSFRGQRFYPGWYWSATVGHHVVYESRLELARLLLADHAPQVVAIRQGRGHPGSTGRGPSTRGDYRRPTLGARSEADICHLRPAKRRLLGGELGLIQFAVQAAAGEQVVVPAPLDDAPFIHNKDLVGAAHGREAVGDD